MERIQIRIPQELLERIDNHAEDLMLDRSSLVRMILNQHIHPLETPHEGDA